MPNKWEKKLDEMESDVSGDTRYIKEGKIRVKLVLEDEANDESWYTPCNRWYKGKKSKKYLLRAIIKGDEKQQVRYLPAPRTVLKQIISMLAEGYELLDTKKSHLISINRSGSGRETTYVVLPSPKVIKIKGDIIDPEEWDTLEEAAEGIEQRDLDREDDDDDETPKKKSGKATKRTGKKNHKADEDDEADENEEDEDEW